MDDPFYQQHKLQHCPVKEEITGDLILHSKRVCRLVPPVEKAYDIGSNIDPDIIGDPARQLRIRTSQSSAHPKSIRFLG
jgi:hypothetical protein